MPPAMPRNNGVLSLNLLSKYLAVSCVSNFLRVCVVCNSFAIKQIETIYIPHISTIYAIILELARFGAPFQFFSEGYEKDSGCVCSLVRSCPHLRSEALWSLLPFATCLTGVCVGGSGIADKSEWRSVASPLWNLPMWDDWEYGVLFFFSLEEST